MSAAIKLDFENVSYQQCKSDISEKFSYDHFEKSLLSKDFILSLHDQAMGKARNYRRCEVELLKTLIEVEKHQIYYQFDLTSLFSYCVDLLGLSKHIAYDLIQVMRVSREVPELLHAIEKNQTTVSKARKICSVITPGNAKEWIDLVINCSCRVVEKAVARKNPRSRVQESLRYISEDILELKLAVSEQWAELLEKTKDRLSQKYQRAVSTEEALFILMREAHIKHDPVMRAKRCALAPATEVQSLAPEKEIICGRRRAIPAQVKHAVYLRDQGQCSYHFKTGERCSAKRWIDIHHIQSFAEGGEHSLNNLETLCRAHHIMKHHGQAFVT